MKLHKAILISLLCVAAPVATALTSEASQVKTIRIGYFEGGEYAVHSHLQSEFSRQLESLLPDTLAFVFVPYGYRSAVWNRDSSKVMARQLAGLDEIDIILAMGPWATEDLLAAGFKKPIIAMHRFLPALEGLTQANGRPVADNLTVHIKPNRLQRDLKTLTRLVSVKRLGVLYFPTGDETSLLLQEISRIGQRLGFEVFSSEGFDREGTYAFFKAYQSLVKKVDAIYLPPLWGMDLAKINEFLAMLGRDRKLAFCTDGIFMVNRGAFASNAGYSLVADARFAALKVLQISLGQKPADLPTNFEGTSGLSINMTVTRKRGIVLNPDDVNQARTVVSADEEKIGEYYSLDEAISRAAVLNPGYQARIELLEVSTQAARQAYAAYLPHLNLDLTYGHLEFKSDRIPNSLTDDRLFTSLRLDQTVFSLKAVRSIEAAAKRQSIQQQDLRQSLILLEHAVTVAYLSFLRAEELVTAHRSDRERIERMMEVAVTRHAIEDGPVSDRLRWEDQRQRSTRKIIALEAELDIARILINVLLNFSGETRLNLDGTPFSENAFWNKFVGVYEQFSSKVKAERINQSLVAMALNESPEINSRQKGIELQRTLLSGNSARFLPTVGFTASLDYNDLVSGSPSVYSFNYSRSWSLGGRLSLPIFEGADRFRERSRLKAELNRAEYAKDQTRLEVMGRVRIALRRVASLIQQMPSSARSRELAMDNLRHVGLKYEQDANYLITSLDGQTNALNAEVAYVNLRYNYYLAVAGIIRTVGKSSQESGRSFLDLFRSMIRR